MTTNRPPPSKPLDLELTIISAKHLKNVNWRNGDLKPYVVFWVDPDRRLATKSYESGSIKPVWNERFTIPLTLPLNDSILTIEVFHSKPSETPKPLVGTVRVPLGELGDDSDESNGVRTFYLARPSGRPHGKISVKLVVRDRPLPPQDYHIAPHSSYYYSSAPAYRGYSPAPSLVPLQAPPYHYGSYSGYYPGYYAAAPPPPSPRPFIERQPSYAGPSAPIDCSQYDQRSSKSGKIGLGTGLAVGAVGGALGGMALDERLKYEEQKICDRVESELAARDECSSYRADY